MEASEGQVGMGQTLLVWTELAGRILNTDTLPDFPFSPEVGVSRDLGPFRLVQ